VGGVRRVRLFGVGVATRLPVSCFHIAHGLD
jgi:hypothetical protein